jgi:glycosyltransferase involved in cell wall biosynthesis
MPPELTVVVATRDRRQSLLRTLDHLAALPEQPPVVVVDNGSSDGGPEAVRRHHPRVTVIEAGRNLGAVARTVGVRAARTPYVAFADDDSWWEPGSLTRAVAHLERHPTLGLVAGRVLVGVGGRLDPVCEAMSRSPLGTRRGMPGPAVVGFVACGAVLRREAYLGVGGFSPVLFFLGEEALLAQDLRAAGWDVAYAPDVVARHGPHGVDDRGDRRRVVALNDLLSVWLRRPRSVVVRHTARAICNVGDPVVRRGLAAAVVRLPEVLRDRRTLPPTVEAEVRLVEADREARETGGGCRATPAGMSLPLPEAKG